MTNGTGIIRSISVFDEDFKQAHPEIITPKTDNPDIDKEIGDSVSLKPVLSDFFYKHNNCQYKTFIGDSAFDSHDTYTMLKNEFSFSRVCIPLNLRNSKTSNALLDEAGTPVCPLDNTPFTFIGKSGGKKRSLRFKWVCHKSIRKGSTRICTCNILCTSSSYGKCTYTYPDKIYVYTPAFRETPNIGIIYIATELLLKEQAISLKIVLVLAH